MSSPTPDLEREQRALSIVGQALAIDDSEARTRWLTGACDTRELRARVDALLALDRTEFRLLRTEAFATPEAMQPELPARIGPWRITGQIGRGGMGTVLRAERDDGVFEQRVAIKLIAAELSDAVSRARFGQERQLLARLIHPHIARILDGGDIDGRPYLVMDLIEGQPVTTFLALVNAPIDEILAIFGQIADAVAHAHRNLVVHADIKPSNILVCGDGSVRLLDFGIARLVVDLDAEEVATPYPLTRGYASPERIAGAKPDVAGDVYALGVLLHELLTGALPDARAMSSHAQHIPGNRLRGDLDAIVAKALRSDPADRYPDVAALQADLKRARAFVPVAARADVGWAYRTDRFIRRHRTGFAVTLLLLSALSIATVVSTRSYVLAERARQEAERRFLDVRQLSRYMLFELYDQLAEAPGTAAPRAQLAATAQIYLDRLARVPGAPVDLRLDLARGYRRLAAVEGLAGVASMGRPDLAARALGQAEGALSPVLKQQPQDAAALEEMGWIEADRWTLHGDDTLSPRTNAAASRWFDAALARDSRRMGARLGLVMTEKNRGYDLVWADRPAEALPVLRRALSRLRALRLTDLDQRHVARVLEVTILNRLGDATYYAGDIAGSLVPYRQAEAIVRTELRRKKVPVWLDRLGEAKYSISGSLGDMPGHEGEALDEARAGIAAMERTLTFGYDASAEKRLVTLLGQEALVLGTLGRPGEAVASSARSVGIREGRLARNPQDPQRTRDLAVALTNHVVLLAKARRNADACATAARAVALWGRIKARGNLSAHDAKKDASRSAMFRAQYCGG